LISKSAVLNSFFRVFIEIKAYHCFSLHVLEGLQAELQFLDHIVSTFELFLKLAQTFFQQLLFGLLFLELLFRFLKCNLVVFTLGTLELEKAVELAEGGLYAKCQLSHFYSSVGRLACQLVAVVSRELLSLAPFLVHAGFQLCR
jgi:hypothetical protein